MGVPADRDQTTTPNTALGVSGTPDAGDAPATCPNCGGPVPERFCGRCGQERRTLRVAFSHVVGEGLSEALSLDSRIARTLSTLVLRPGEATRSYLAGKRASQTSPVKLYLLLSFLYFFLGAFTPTRMQFTAGGAEPPEATVAVSDKDLTQLREQGTVGARIADHLERIGKLPPDELRRRVGASFAENAPKAMFFLVPLLALLLRIFFLRSGLFYAEDVVLALHEHAVAFLFLLPAQVANFWGRSSTLQGIGIFAAALHGTVALRRVFERSWPATLLRAALIGLIYVMLLGLALLGVVLFALAQT